MNPWSNCSLVVNFILDQLIYSQVKNTIRIYFLIHRLFALRKVYSNIVFLTAKYELIYNWYCLPAAYWSAMVVALELLDTKMLYQDHTCAYWIQNIEREFTLRVSPLLNLSIRNS